MTSGIVDLAILGALVIAVAALSAGIAATAATNRALRDSCIRWQSAAEAVGITGHAADRIRVIGRVELADGSLRSVRGATIGQVIAAYGATNPDIVTPPDAWD